MIAHVLAAHGWILVEVPPRLAHQLVEVPVTARVHSEQAHVVLGTLPRLFFNRAGVSLQPKDRLDAYLQRGFLRTEVTAHIPVLAKGERVIAQLGCALKMLVRSAEPVL